MGVNFVIRFSFQASDDNLNVPFTGVALATATRQPISINVNPISAKSQQSYLVRLKFCKQCITVYLSGNALLLIKHTVIRIKSVLFII